MIENREQTEKQKLIETISKNMRYLAPHVKQRLTAKLLQKSIIELKNEFKL